MEKNYLGDLFSKKVTKRRPIWAKSLLWRQSTLKTKNFGHLYFGHFIFGQKISDKKLTKFRTFGQKFRTK